MKLMVGGSNYIMEEWASINLVPNDPAFPRIVVKKKQVYIAPLFRAT